MTVIEIILLGAALMAVEGLYVWVARRFGLCMPTDRPGDSRRAVTPAGGGVVYIAAAVACLLLDKPVAGWTVAVMVGTLVLGLVSFVDDVSGLSAVLRLLVQIGLSAAMVAICTDCALAPEYYVLAVVGVVGMMNAFNFMDGINGMLCLYAGVTLGTLWFLTDGAEREVCAVFGLASAVLMVFNLRPVAKVFAGDVGSISVGFVVAMVLIELIMVRGDVSVLVLVSVFLTDTFVTFLSRLLNGEAVMSAHRKHLYQQLVYGRRASALTVSAAYAVLQVIINAGWLVCAAPWRGLYAIGVYVALMTAYLWLKMSVKKQNI